MGKKVQEEVQVLEVTRIGDELIINAKCDWMVMFSIIRQLVEAMADSTNGQVYYNDILDDLKEVGLGADM